MAYWSMAIIVGGGRTDTEGAVIEKVQEVCVFNTAQSILQLLWVFWQAHIKYVAQCL